MFRLLVACLVASTVLHAAAVAAAPPNVLLLVSDDQRPDTIGLVNEMIATPHLDELARSGALFTRGTCANPICTPSRAEILTGASSFSNGVLDFGRRIRPEMALWAATIREAGYRTWYVGKWHNDGRPIERGYDETRALYAGGGGRWAVPQFDWAGRPVTGYRGWVQQDDDGTRRPERGVGLTPNIGAAFADAAVDLIRREPSEPFFLHVNFPGPHDPLLIPFGYEGRYPPAQMQLPANFLPEHPFDHGNFDGRDERLFRWPRTPAETRGELAAYYSVISHVDEQVGRILAALRETGQFDNTIVIYTSDHGLAVGSHGLRGKQNMYEHTIGVPLIVKAPGIAGGQRLSAQCYLRDLFPTVCDLVGIPIPGSVEGRSLKPVLNGQTEELYDYVFGYFRKFQRMIRGERYKLIHYPQIDRTQLFDLQADPFELRDLSQDPQHAEVRRRLAAALGEWQRAVGDPLLED